MPVRQDNLIQIDGGTYAFMHLPGGWGQTNTGLVVGDDASMVIDTVWDTSRAESIAQAWPDLVGSAAITEAVNTHSDGDHWWGNDTLPASARITTSESALHAMKEDTPPAAVARFSKLGSLASALPGPAGALGSYMSRVTGGASLPTRPPGSRITHSPAPTPSPSGDAPCCCGIWAPPTRPVTSSHMYPTQGWCSRATCCSSGPHR